MEAFWILLTLALSVSSQKSFRHALGNAVVKSTAVKTKILKIWSWRYLVNKLFNRTYSNERSVQATDMFVCVVVACFITNFLGKLGGDGVIFMEVIIKKTLCLLKLLNTPSFTIP